MLLKCSLKYQNNSLSLSLSVCLSVSVTVCLSLSVSLSVCLSFSLSIVMYFVSYEDPLEVNDDNCFQFSFSLSIVM